MHTHGTEVRQKAIMLLRSGVRNADVARELGVPVGTIGHWLHLDRARHGTLPGKTHRPCPRCDSRELDHAAYAYLLGLYLGDGHIIQYSQHRAPSLMIACSESWPGLIDECKAAMRRVFPDNSVCQARRPGCRNVKVYSKHLWCVFPQHGPGKKHDRVIALEPWQQSIVDAHPWKFIRGLFHSDGCRITNWTTRLVAGERKRYEYPRYFFTNKSDDIRKLCSDTLTKVGVEWTTLARGSDPFNISVARRASVALMDKHVGPKY
ncbi:sigma-70 region 4 domain-containing protein [Streptomyces malaysiensis subsp. malaysiensis]|uniref:Sigma-70 region 4 domain-containing protein n=1 Tax=Streptomyces malaysiensis TaxID=92644 RepID=A0ABX6W7J1_STRMQ|nr:MULTISPECIES: sigma-70 region 4 domain-containing protein [Streptomyces]QPI55691.1 sigma-70 region 4 domain-containing protein [Streptomyces solisilvae]UHH17149.1 sigma-70 region 4 domain-containing protein [Streptomyces sp. HNM0561]